MLVISMITGQQIFRFSIPAFTNTQLKVNTHDHKCDKSINYKPLNYLGRAIALVGNTGAFLIISQPQESRCVRKLRSINLQDCKTFPITKMSEFDRSALVCNTDICK